MSLFKNTWFSKLAGKKNNTLEKEAAELAAKESAEQEAAELAAKELAEQEVAELAAKELAEKEIAEEEAKEDAEDYVFKSWFSRLGIGLSKTSSRISEGITKALRSGRLDDDALEQIEENLILADVGATAASELISVLKNEKFDKIDDVNIKERMAEIITKNISVLSHPLVFKKLDGPQVVLFSGVNGAGKTTTIAKIASQEIKKGNKVIIAAADTFRAAAVQQLEIWAKRVGAELVSGPEGGDPAGVAFRAYDKAIEDKADILLIDTAGRLQTQTNLMEQLKKINRVINKKNENAPHHRILIVDATAGQNVQNQILAFREAIDINGIIVTKLDTSSKGGIIISISNTHKIPIHAIGVGEKQEDLNIFEAKPYARAMLGLEINKN
ncbi:MAG: signal recognition particle-docking protein FtsY [Pelagibacterales bacterium]|nr:signal recognition particle-docking protein FtsY [Pelagibacterales bacterium]